MSSLESIVERKFTLLRRMLTGYMGTSFTMDEIRKVLDEMKCKNEEELDTIHWRLFGASELNCRNGFRGMIICPHCGRATEFAINNLIPAYCFHCQYKFYNPTKDSSL